MLAISRHTRPWWYELQNWPSDPAPRGPDRYVGSSVMFLIYSTSQLSLCHMLTPTSPVAQVRYDVVVYSIQSRLPGTLICH
jgi:hypothetical protein